MSHTPLPSGQQREVAVTPGEYRVCRALCIDGAVNRLLAKRLLCTEDTIKTHIKQLLMKTGCADRTALAVAVWSGRIELVTTPYGCEKRFLLRELWSMLGHPAVVDAQQTA